MGTLWLNAIQNTGNDTCEVLALLDWQCLNIPIGIMQTPRLSPLCLWGKFSHCLAVAMVAISYYDLCLLGASYPGLEPRSDKAEK